MTVYGFWKIEVIQRINQFILFNCWLLTSSNENPDEIFFKITQKSPKKILITFLILSQVSLSILSDNKNFSTTEDPKAI